MRIRDLKRECAHVPVRTVWVLGGLTDAVLKKVTYREVNSWKRLELMQSASKKKVRGSQKAPRPKARSELNSIDSYTQH